MRPAEGEPDLARRPVRQQALEAAIAVHLQHALELGQVGGRVLALAVLGVEVDHRRRGAAVPGPVVDRIAPQAPGLGPAPAGVEHRQRRVVGEDPGRAHDVPAQQAPQRLQPPAGPADPVAQGRAVELDPLPGEDLRLAVERQEIGVLGHQHVREQRLGRHPAGDRPLRCGGLHHRLLAGPAAVAGSADHLHPQLGGDDVEHLARVLADHVQGPAAAGAALVLDVDQDLDPRQVRRQGAQIASPSPGRPRGAAAPGSSSPAPPRPRPRSARGPPGRAAAGRGRAAPSAGRTARAAAAGSRAAASRSRLVPRHARHRRHPAQPEQYRARSRE